MYQDKTSETGFVHTPDLIPFMRELGLDAVDLFVGRGVNSRDPEYLFPFKIACLKNGLSVGYLASGVSLAGPTNQMGDKIEQAKRDIDAASFLGAEMVHVFARGVPVPEDKKEFEVIWKQMIDHFRQVCDYAYNKGVVIGVQNHNNKSWALTADRVLRILNDTNRPNFTFILDTGQWLGSIGSDPRGEFDPEVDIYKDYIEPTAPKATCVRAKIYKIDTGREEFLDYDRILGILKKVGFNGHISIVLEHVNKLYDRFAAVRRSVHHLRALLKKHDI